MLNLLSDYISHSIPEGEFVTNPGLEKKVDAVGRFLPYQGSTLVFRLEEKDCRQLNTLCDKLYCTLPDLLAERLRPDTFHMTMHDLVNGVPDQPGLQERMTEAVKNAEAVLREVKTDGCLHMRGTWLFNMVNTSIVLGLEPMDPQTWKRLDEMYMALERVVTLGYPFTPHITMAYFRPGRYSPEQVQRLSAAMHPVHQILSFPMSDLIFQTFSDMNHYVNFYKG